MSGVDEEEVRKRLIVTEAKQIPSPSLIDTLLQEDVPQTSVHRGAVWTAGWRKRCVIDFLRHGFHDGA